MIVSVISVKMVIFRVNLKLFLQNAIKMFETYKNNKFSYAENRSIKKFL